MNGKIDPPVHTTRDSPIQGISGAEWAARRELAALYRAMHRYGMTDLIYNHITARVPGEPDQILINPYGLMYHEVTASCLYKIRLNGEVLYRPEEEYGLNPAGYVIHTAVHSARHDVLCVLHTHSRAGTAVSAMEGGLRPLSQQSAYFHGRLAYHDFQGPEISLEQQQGLIDDLGQHNAAILRNHGLLVCGRTVAEAFFNIYWLESACKVQVDALACGRDKLIEFGEKEAKATRDALGVQKIRGDREWAAVLRDLDRIDPSYRN